MVAKQSSSRDAWETHRTPEKVIEAIITMDNAAQRIKIWSMGLVVDLPKKSHVPDHSFFISRYQRIYNFTTSTCVWQYAFNPFNAYSTFLGTSKW